jgi:hypothetical protein
VKQHSGSIEIDSEPGEYTEVRIILDVEALFRQHFQHDLRAGPPRFLVAALSVGS